MMMATLKMKQWQNDDAVKTMLNEITIIPPLAIAVTIQTAGRAPQLVQKFPRQDPALLPQVVQQLLRLRQRVVGTDVAEPNV